MSTQNTSGPPVTRGPEPEKAPRACWNEDCRSADPRQHTIWVAVDPKEPWLEEQLCTGCYYAVRSCSLCAHSQPIGSADDDGECRLSRPPWEAVGDADWCEEWEQECPFTPDELRELLCETEGGQKLRHLRAVGDAAASTPPEQEEPSDEGTDEG